MTMPHLMNCPHSGDGWCLKCVKEQWEELQRHKETIEQIDLTLRIPAAEYVPAIGDVFTLIDQLKSVDRH